MLAKPVAAHIPVGPYRVAIAHIAYRIGYAPDIGVVMRHPSLGAIKFIRGIFSRHGKIADKIEQGLVHLRQIGQLRRPVIHLRVDIDGIVRAPGRPQFFIP